MTALNSTNVIFWGVKDYPSSNRLQERAWEIVSGSSLDGVVLGGEITPTITQGIRAKPEDIIQQPIKASQIPVFQIKRGGETTLHTRGQLVIYPVIDIRLLNMGVREYVNSLLKISKKCFEYFGVAAETNQAAVGLFTKVGKIAFCGLRIKKGISQHGLSFNIQNNLSEFNSIVSCGIAQAQFDKLQNYNPSVSPEMFFNQWIELASLEGILRKSQSLASNSMLSACDPLQVFQAEASNQDL